MTDLPSTDPVVPDASSMAERIDPTFRNGSITAFGVTTSFSLGFLSQWAASPGVWQTYDTPPVLLIFVGVSLQMRALYLLLPVDGLRRKIYDRATRTYMIGMIMTGAGVFSAVSADAVSAFFK